MTRVATESAPTRAQAADHEGSAFPRPTTRLNALVEGALRLWPARQLDNATLRRLQGRSEETLRQLGASQEILDRILRDTPWEVLDERAPPDAWGGEVLRTQSGPRVVMYQESPLTHVPTAFVFNIAFQLAVDHMYGHLYEYHRGAEDWGEEVACRWQYQLLRRRGGLVNELTARLVAWTHRMHKQIPLSNYEHPS